MNSRSVPTVLLILVLIPGTVYTCCGFVTKDITKKEALYEPAWSSQSALSPGYLHTSLRKKP